MIDRTRIGENTKNGLRLVRVFVCDANLIHGRLSKGFVSSWHPTQVPFSGVLS